MLISRKQTSENADGSVLKGVGDRLGFECCVTMEPQAVGADSERPHSCSSACRLDRFGISDKSDPPIIGCLVFHLSHGDDGGKHFCARQFLPIPDRIVSGFDVPFACTAIISMDDS